MDEQEIKLRFPRASRSFIEANEAEDHSPLPHAEFKHNQAPALDSSDAGEKEIVLRVTVRFKGFRVRPLDPDNFAGSCKDLLDGLRHAKLIPGDEPWRIIFETAQEKVAHYSEEKTLIEIMNLVCPVHGICSLNDLPSLVCSIAHEAR